MIDSIQASGKCSIKPVRDGNVDKYSLYSHMLPQSIDNFEVLPSLQQSFSSKRTDNCRYSVSSLFVKHWWHTRNILRLWWSEGKYNLGYRLFDYIWLCTCQYSRIYGDKHKKLNRSFPKQENPKVKQLANSFFLNLQTPSAIYEGLVGGKAHFFLGPGEWNQSSAFILGSFAYYQGRQKSLRLDNPRVPEESLAHFLCLGIHKLNNSWHMLFEEGKARFGFVERSLAKWGKLDDTWCLHFDFHRLEYNRQGRRISKHYFDEFSQSITHFSCTFGFKTFFTIRNCYSLCC